MAFSDEMRLGLIAQVRRVLASRGVKIVQPLQREYKYLLLAGLPMMGKLLWEWMPQMKQAGLVPILQGWSQHLSINIWHGAGVHRAKTFTTYLEPALFNWLTPPQLNPAEQVFQEVGRHVEGKVYPTLRSPKHVNVTAKGADGEGLLLNLDIMGIAASSGSACASGSLEPSHVLTALGRSGPEAKASVRFSLGRYTTEAEVDRAIAVFGEAVGRSRIAV